MKHPYEPFLHHLRKPAQYVGGEYHQVRKDWDRARYRVALAFPDAYEVGMSHLGLKILYGVLNDDPDTAAERVFAPWPDLEEKLRETGVPLVSIESRRPIAGFDVVGFSLQYELTFTNLLNMLDLAGMPLRTADRRSNEFPLVVAGGPVATQPEPLAPFIDCFVIGDGEVAFPRLIRRYVTWRDEGLSRQEILIRLSQEGGVYCPSLYSRKTEAMTGLAVVDGPLHDGVPPRVERRIVESLDEHPFPSKTLVPSTQVVFDRFSVEIARGCTEGCRFCQAGMIYRPVRERRPREIIDTIMGAVRQSGYGETALTSLSTADYSCVSPLVLGLMEELRREKVSLGVSSLRAYGIPEELLSAISEVRNTSLTFAPEAGTQRMRDVVNKNISEEDMERAAAAVFSRGWKRCKLYFMIGLPTESDQDVLGIAETGRKYLEIARRYHRGRTAEVTVSVSSHVPKPHTPFQWCQMDDLSEIERKQALLFDAVRGSRIRLKWHDARISHLEGIISRGDENVADLIEYAFRNGCRFDGWDEHFRFDVWIEGLDRLGIDRHAYLKTAPIDARLPWDHIDVGLKRGFLEREYRRALKDRLSPPCGKPLRSKVHATNLEDADADRRPLVCFDCGVACDLTRMREERKDFLRSVGALTRPAPRAVREEVHVESIRARNERPRTRIRNDARERYRLVFEKAGVQRFISHLDLVRLLPRVFRRAGVPMAYSLGFHPKPVMTFSPALPLGWASRGEFLDVKLSGRLDVEDLLHRLERASPEGIRFTGAVVLNPGDRSISRLLDLADYTVRLDRSVDLERLRDRLERIRAGEPVLVSRRGSARLSDVSPSIVSARYVSCDAGQGDLRDPALEAERGRLLVRIRLGRPPPARPDDVARWASGSRSGAGEVERVALWHLCGEGVVSPLDAERLRQMEELAARAPSGIS